MGRRFGRSLLAAGVVAALCAAGGFAYAKSAGDGVIEACAKTETGQLRLDTGGGCLPSEQALQLNQGRPAHAIERSWYRGPDVGSWQEIVTGTWPDVKPNLTQLLTVHLDPGNYVVSMETIASNEDGQGIVVCMLRGSAGLYALSQTAVGGWRAGFALQQTATAQATVTLDTADDLAVKCFNAPPNDPAGSPRIGFVDVIATTVDTVDAS